jgi:hypothetical protein
MGVGSYAISGGNVEADYQMAMLQGTYTYAGVAVALKRGYTPSMVAGSYGINGQALQLRRGLSMVLTSGAYTIAGQAVQLVKSTSKTIFLPAAPYVIAGQNVTFRRTYALRCEPGSYALTGYDLPLNYVEVQHYFMPYLNGSTEDAARVMIESIHSTLVVIGSGGTVVSQIPPHMSIVLKGQVVTITMGGVIYHTHGRRRHGLPPYTRGGCN